MNPDENNRDVVVIGGGPSGIGAAVGAAQMGLRVVLVERYPHLGGMGTAALVNNFCRAHFDGRRMIIGGVFGRLRQRLIDRKALYTDVPHLEPYHPDAFIEEAAALCRAAGVELILGRKIRSVTPELHLRLDDGRELCGQTVVDATGDAFVAAQAGVPFNMGRATDHAVMPLTFCYMMGPIDLVKAKRETPQFVFHDSLLDEDFYYLSGCYPELDARIAAARKDGELRIERDHISGILSVPTQPQHATVNYGRVNITDPTDPVQLAAAEAEGRRQIEDGLRFFRRHLPGLERVELVQIARQIGVRESRQIIGRYTLTGEDALSGRQFDDAIAQCCYPVDIHHPNSDKTTITGIGGPGHYDIPWRCLIPQTGPPHLIVAGRCISATHEAMSSFRVSPSVMAIGEAAGVTAALAVRRQIAIAKVPVEAVQEQLVATGGILT